MQLAFESFGNSGPLLLIAHGLFGSARNWRGIARKLSENRPVIAVDMRNHGDSFRDPDHSYAAMAQDLFAIIADHGGKADVLGHSMGGKAAMMLALTQPETVRKLIVADIAPKVYTHSQLPVIDALRTVNLAEVARRSDADRQLEAVVPDRALRAFLIQSLDLGDGARWKLNLDALSENMNEIMGFPESPSVYNGPTLALAGAASDYVGQDDLRLMKDLFPNVQHRSVSNAGHWLHAEQPEAFIKEVEAFLTA
jgi:pimeloyl-ACP methyl ester carboxylesterase